MQITITQAHIKLLRRLEFDWDDAIEFGAVCSDFKRPYGNGGVLEDIAEILHLPVDEDGVQTGLTWAQARRLTAELAGIVNLVISRAPLGELVGLDVDMAWRADRTTKPHGLDLSS